MHFIESRHRSESHLPNDTREHIADDRSEEQEDGNHRHRAKYQRQGKHAGRYRLSPPKLVDRFDRYDIEHDPIDDSTAKSQRMKRMKRIEQVQYDEKDC